MTAADLLDQLGVAGLTVGLEFEGDLIIRATPVAQPAAQGEPFSNSTRSTDGTGWVDKESTQL